MLTRLVPPSSLPVDLAEFRSHLWTVFEGHDDDSLLTTLLEAATGRAETILARRLITQTWRITASGAATGIVLPFGSFQAVSGAAWSVDGSTWTTIDPSLVTVDTTTVLAVANIDWSGIDTAKVAAARVDWSCGYGDSPADVPADIRMAIKQLAAHWYRLRAATTLDDDEGVAKVVPFAFSALLHSHRLNFIG